MSFDGNRLVSTDRRTFVSTAVSLAAGAAIAPSNAFDIRLSAVTADDPLGVRADFPILQNGRTFLNSAYITPSPRAVTDVGIAFLQSKGERALNVGEMLGRNSAVRTQFAKLVNAAAEEIGFVFATTEGENIVANNVPMNAGDNVVVDDLHYDGALVVYRELEKRRGITLRIVKHRDGMVAPADFAKQIDNRTRLVSVSLVSSVNGLRHDARALADIAHANGALLHLDAIQALGTFPVDVKAMDTDFMCAGTYKGLLGGFGVAPFFIKRSLLNRVPPDRFGIFQVTDQTPDFHFTLRSDAKRHDYATLPFAEVQQLGAGLSYLEKIGIARIETHLQALTHKLRDGLLAQKYRLFTPVGTRAAITAFHSTKPSADIRAAFDAAKIDATIREGHVRISLGLFNNSEDIDRLLDVTQRLA